MQLPTKEPNPLNNEVHVIDSFNRNPLFLVTSKKLGEQEREYVVKTWEEAFAIHGKPSIDDISPEFIAGIISENATTKFSPYKRIKRLPTSSKVIINEKGFIEKTIKRKRNELREKLTEKDLLFIVKTSLENSISNKLSTVYGNIGIEHSSGIDSNSILSLIVSHLGISKDRIHTFTNEKAEGEVMKECRKSYNLLQSNIHKNNIKSAIYNEDYKDIINILGAPTFSNRSIQFLRILERNNCEILFSGLGGDQGISHHGLNAATNLVLEKRFNDLIKWSGGKKKAMITFLSRTLTTSIESYAKYKINKISSKSEKEGLLVNCLSSKGKELFRNYFQEPNLYEIDIYSPMNVSINNRIYSDTILLRMEEETRLAQFFNIEKLFPLLDENLINILINQDPTYFSKGKNDGRLILKNALKDYLPNYLNVVHSKFREVDKEGFKADLKFIIQYLEEALTKIETMHEKIHELWDIEKIIMKGEYLLNKNHINMRYIFRYKSSIDKLFSLNYWFSKLENI